MSPVNSVTKKQKESGPAVNLPGAGRLQKATESLRSRFMGEDTKRPVTTLKALRSSEALVRVEVKMKCREILEEPVHEAKAPQE